MEKPLPATPASLPGCGFESWLLHLHFSLLPVLWESSRGWTWAPAGAWETPELWTADSGLAQPQALRPLGSVQSIHHSHILALSLPLSLLHLSVSLPFKQTFKKKKKKEFGHCQNHKTILGSHAGPEWGAHPEACTAARGQRQETAQGH